MKKQSKDFQLTARPTEALIAQAKKKMGLFIALIEAARFVQQDFITFLGGPDKMHQNTLRNNMDRVISQHRAAEKKANPEGFEKYELAFDECAGFFIDLFEEVQKAGFEKSLILLKAFNQGEVKMAGRGNHKPAKDLSLEEFATKAA